jgi:hypothetical protein
VTDDNYEDSNEEPQPKYDVSSLIKSHQEFGWPLIPKRSDKRLEELKAILRAYVIATYRESQFSCHYVSPCLAIILQAVLPTISML